MRYSCDNRLTRVVLSTKIMDQLEKISGCARFEDLSSVVIEDWRSLGVGNMVIEPVLRFMENHPEIDFGMPGRLVHFLEEFYGRGYEEDLMASVERKPTQHTVWMLNRVINGQNTPDQRQPYLDAMEDVTKSENASAETKSLARHFVSLTT